MSCTDNWHNYLTECQEAKDKENILSKLRIIDSWKMATDDGKKKNVLFQ